MSELREYDALIRTLSDASSSRRAIAYADALTQLSLWTRDLAQRDEVRPSEISIVAELMHQLSQMILAELTIGLDSYQPADVVQCLQERSSGYDAFLAHLLDTIVQSLTRSAAD